MSELAKILDELVKLNQELDGLDEEVDKVSKKARRSKRAWKRYMELYEERRRLAERIEELERKANELLEPLVNEVRAIHKDFRDLNAEWGRDVHYVRINIKGVVCTTSFLGGKQVSVEGPLVVIRTHYLHVKDIGEVERILETLHSIAKKYSVRIVFIVDGRLDHFTLPYEEREKLRGLPWFLCESAIRDYYFLVQPA